MFCTSASYLVARFHKVSFMHSRDTGPLDNLGPFGPIVNMNTINDVLILDNIEDTFHGKLQKKMIEGFRICNSTTSI